VIAPNEAAIGGGSGLMYRSLERVKAIAEAVARDVHDRVEIAGVTPGEARRGHAEIVAVHRDLETGAQVVVIGVDRSLTEPALREQISIQLRRLVA
jgi:hypothetical protein